MRTVEIKYHSKLLDIIENFKKPKWGLLISKNSIFNNNKAYFRPKSKGFEIKFQYDLFSKSKKRIDLGHYYKKVQIQFGNSFYELESTFCGTISPPHVTGSIDRIRTKGFSENQKYYYQLVIPLEKEIKFHFNIKRIDYYSDLGYHSICSTIATLEGEQFQACCIHNKKKDFFLVIDSKNKHTFEEFLDKATAVKTGIGYLTGYYAGNQAYFFAHTTLKKKEPKHFRCLPFRDSINSIYSPIYSNAYAYLTNKQQAESYALILRPVSLVEFSTLCKLIYESIDFSSIILLILESSVASFLFMPGGFAIALEAISDLIIGDKKLKLTPIKNKELNRVIRREILSVIEKYKTSILPEDWLTLNNRINQLNQITNKARLKAPFDLLNIKLLDEDLRILETRNDFLHGRIPDLTNAGIGRPTDRINQDIYYASMRLYTLLNMLILKWVGYDNRVVNYPKIHEDYTEIILKEEPYRQV